MWDRTKLYWAIFTAAIGAVFWFLWHRGNKYMRQVAITGAEAKLAKHLENKNEAKRAADRLESEFDAGLAKYEESRKRLRKRLERVRKPRP